METNVEIKTPDGTCDAAFIHPASGAHPAVIIWPDAFGLRPSMRDMAKRLAAAGYSVLVPNPFYRVAKSPVFEDASKVDFQKERPKITPLMGSITGGWHRGTRCARVRGLARHAERGRSQQEDRDARLLHGRRARRQDRRGGAESHRRRRVVPWRRAGDRPTRTVRICSRPKIKARMYFGIATNDDMQQPDAKTKLRESFDAAKVPAEIEVYSMAQHGWCVPDMPAGANGPIYNKADAERAWTKLRRCTRPRSHKRGVNSPRSMTPAENVWEWESEPGRCYGTW